MMHNTPAHYLAEFSYEEIKHRINAFENTDFKKMNPNDIHRKVIELFAKITNNKTEIQRELYQIFMPKGNMFYRVRRLQEGDYYADEQDFWWNPAPPLGRLNRDGQPVLYACWEKNPIQTAISETGICCGESFIVFSYKSIEEMNYTTVGTTNNFYQQNSNEYEKHLLVEKFFEELFTKTWNSKEDDHIYHTAQAIARYYFAFGKDNSGKQYNDAFLYPSVKTKVLNNIAIHVESARAKLELCGAVISEWEGIEKFKIKGYLKREKGKTIGLPPSADLASCILPNYSIRGQL